MGRIQPVIDTTDLAKRTSMSCGPPNGFVLARSQMGSAAISPPLRRKPTVVMVLLPEPSQYRNDLDQIEDYPLQEALPWEELPYRFLGPSARQIPTMPATRRSITRRL